MELLKNIKLNNDNDWVNFVIISLFLLILGPIIIYILKIFGKLLLNYYRFIWDLLFPESNKNNSLTESSSPQISINNKPQPAFLPKNDKDLTLIEIKMIELAQKEENQKQYNSLHLELIKNKLQNKIELNEQKHYFENKLLEQKISNLEKQLQKQVFKQSQNQYSKDNKINKTDDIAKDKTAEQISLDIIEESVKNQIPNYLKEIFEKVENIENIQLFMLKNTIDKKSYYDHDHNTLYIHPNDLVFIKTLLNKEEEKHINPKLQIN
ncbi:MAG: hypothetical protein Q8784_01690 [Vigna little leaf phytoplasma]|nr:hypothetical protein [Vigna little leaf phytoplasma]